ncbi:MAG: hypothetical protein GSR84_03165 [Desulfurococcales archaeon]|nr:hypothetical protein [Desulfurococcales archaeon]
MGWWSLGNAKSDSYTQLTIRIPRGLFKYIDELSKRWGTTYQDTILLILWDWALGDDSG